MAFVEQASKMGRENQKNFLRYGISFIRECCMLMSGCGQPGALTRAGVGHCAKND